MKTQTPLAQKVDHLRSCSLFKEIRDDATAMEGVAELFETQSFSRGSHLIKEGELGYELFILKNGTVEITKRTLGGDSYTVVELSGDNHPFFGEIALLDADKRSASVCCKSDCEVYVLNRDRFISFGNDHPTIGLSITREISRILSNRLRKANQDIITLFDALVGEVVESGGLSES